jgi:2-hydroxychromene-2-carboxylate isomerase
MDFWFTIGSTYTYLGIMRIADVVRHNALRVRWRPFNVRDIMLEMNNVPFATKPVKAAYMWRDIERRAAMYGIPYVGKPSYPSKDVPRANRVAIVAAKEGWVELYGPAIYRGYFVDNLDPGSDEGITAACEAIGQEPARVIGLADSEEVAKELAEQTNVARSLGIFGSPTWAVGTEIFWGDDRLRDAMRWARSGTLCSS